MAYFANGAEADGWQAWNCERCRNWRSRDGDPENVGCPVWDAHMWHGYGGIQVEVVLRVLIPEKRVNGYLAAAQCAMFEEAGT